MECEKQRAAQSNLYPTAPAGDPNPPPYAALQSPYPIGIAYPQAPQQQAAYNQPYPYSPQHSCGDTDYRNAPLQPYNQVGYPFAGSGPPAYGYPAPGAAGYGQQPQMVVMAPQPQTVVVLPNDVSMTGAIALSCFVFWCFGCPCGFVAFILALFGQSSSSSGNAKFATKLRNVSYGVSVVGIVVPIIVVILVMVYLYYFTPDPPEPK